MVDIGEFAGRAAAKFLKSQQGIPEAERFNLSLSQKAVEDFIKSSFYASLIPDENRWPCVCLICYKKGSEIFPILRDILFASPRDISAEEIARLSHAVADNCHIYCISDNGKLTIGGIRITRPYEERYLGYSSFRLGNPLKLFIRGPGHIEMSTGGTAIVYKSGEISEESLLQYSRIMEELESTIGQSMKSYTSGTVEGLADIFNDIAEIIVNLGHGGLLLIAPEHEESYFSSLTQADSAPLRQLLIQYWNNVALLLDEAGGRANLLRSGGAGYKHSPIIAANTEMLEQCVRAVAHLAGMDGAIVLNNECQVVAFNAIIHKLGNDPKAHRFVDNDNTNIDYEDVLRNRGSRHQSALSFVMHVPKSYAFVISQDGFVSAFHNPDNGTIMCERGMRVLE